MNNTGVVWICVVLVCGFMYVGDCINSGFAANKKMMMSLGTVVGDMENELSSIQSHIH